MRLFQQIDPRTFVYRVDARGRLIAVNDAWLAFAAENDWPIAVGDIIGRPLMDFIADEHLRYLYGLLMGRLRAGRGPLRFRYRCDAPDARRHMEMLMLYDKTEREIEFQSRVVRIERRSPQDLLRIDHPADERRLDICSSCKRVDLGQQWVEVEDAVIRLRLFESELLPRTRHSICPDCAKDLAGLAKSGPASSSRPAASRRA
ncbi:MAG: hypothetical protein LJE69_03835 [Thiohalocapsa sp.]|jgi:hypothetical protein|uniref:hypothetical protein n=1 Tax=Thiohalocapsa sp. TaxID=2497641 RepID=UPI0025DD180D|nr:hypothetical protein [Thiohalocapsa sp.]MCG6940366.1 hypothetical protein [Thiohalocapsa sp.]